MIEFINLGVSTKTEKQNDGRRNLAVRNANRGATLDQFPDIAKAYDTAKSVTSQGEKDN